MFDAGKTRMIGLRDMLRSVGLASSVMSSLQRIWKCSYFSTNTKVHLYQALVISVLLYGAETWTLLAADRHARSISHEVPAADAQHPLVGPYHQCRGTPENLSTISKILRNRRLSLFGHVARLDPEVPANKALLLMVNSHEGRKPSTSWTRPPGRPRRTWLNLVKEDANAPTFISMEN